MATRSPDSLAVAPPSSHRAWLSTLWSEWDAAVSRARATELTRGASPAPSRREWEQLAHLEWARGRRPPLPHRQARGA